MCDEGWTCIYCFGKNNEEFLIRAKLKHRTNEAAWNYVGGWLCSKGIKFKKGEMESGSDGSLYLFKNSKRNNDNPAFRLDAFFTGDGVKNSWGNGNLHRSWVDKTNEGEHRWTIDPKKVEEWRNLTKAAKQKSSGSVA